MFAALPAFLVLQASLGWLFERATDAWCVGRRLSVRVSVWSFDLEHLVQGDDDFFYDDVPSHALLQRHRDA